MLTTINLVNICHKIFFLVITTRKVYSISNIQVCSTVLLTIVTMLCMLVHFFLWYLHAVRTSGGASLVVQLVKNLPAMQETPVQFLGREDPLEKG